jgi:protein O-GlcNAc transferase
MAHEPNVPLHLRELFLEAVEHHKAGRAAAAERGYRALLEQDPAIPGALANLGDLVYNRGLSAEAFELYDRALALAPDDTVALTNRGRALLGEGRTAEAEAGFRAVLAIDPDDPRALNNLGEILLRRNAFEEAHALLARAVRVAPDSAAAHTTFGKLLLLGGRVTDALVVLERAVKLAPASAEARSVLAGALWTEGRIEESLRQHREALRLRPALFETWSLLLFTMHCGAGRAPAELFAEHLRFGRALEQSVATERRDLVADPTPGRRLRVAYLSSDLRRHPVGLFLAPVIEAHSREHFEVFAYSSVASTDDVQARLRAAVDRWVDASGLTDQALTARIREDRIDLLVDLGGHTTNGRLGVLARRAAPVQLSWLGYPDTTGLSTVDYRITDAVADPPGESDALHTEELLRLPGGFLAWQATSAAADAEPPCASAGHVTFGSFNNASKLSPELARCWAEILRAVPGSRMILKHQAFEREANRARVRGWFEEAGIAADRLEFVGFAARWQDAYALYARVDLALDSFPYNGATTTCEALSQGVPVVALRGSAHAGRVSSAMLTALGETSLIAGSEAEYISIATALGLDPARLAALRASLPARWRESSVGSPERLARELEDAYRLAWQRTLSGAPRKALPTTVGEVTLGPRDYDLVDCAGDVQVALPPSLENLTAYVLREQGDWFEAELPFVRSITQPGTRALDCGANYGLYTLALARAAGPSGRVWSVEPSSRTSAFLRASVESNGFTNVTVVQAALSDHSGEASLHMGSWSELAALTADPTHHSSSEVVTLHALDEVRDSLDLRRIDFVKLDAEGEEVRIIQGGQRFFTEESPLVMTEIRHGSVVNTGLHEAFAALGYGCYRLIPGLQLLAFTPSIDVFDGFALNLFFCKPDRAEQLAARGLLAPPAAALDAPAAVGRWRDELAALPYVRQLLPYWNSQHAGRGELEAALDRWCDAHDPALSASSRVRSLEAALDLLSAALDLHPTLPRLVTVARVAWEIGLRETAVGALRTAVEWFTHGEGIALDEPFLVPCPRFDAVRIPSNEATWCFAAVLEQFERLRSFSSYYEGRNSRPFLESISQLGFMGDEMRRRQELIDARFGAEE